MVAILGESEDGLSNLNEILAVPRSTPATTRPRAASIA
jgi:hypothetical protein